MKRALLYILAAVAVATLLFAAVRANAITVCPIFSG